MDWMSYGVTDDYKQCIETFSSLNRAYGGSHDPILVDFVLNVGADETSKLKALNEAQLNTHRNRAVRLLIWSSFNINQ